MMFDDETPEETSDDETGAEAAQESSDDAPDADAETAADEESAEGSDEESAAAESEDGESELTLASEDVEEPRPPRQPTLIRGKIDRHGVAIGTGRRKTAVARVRIKDGEGNLTVNGRSLDHYFPLERDRLLVTAPLKSTETLESVDVWVRVNGGGMTGQAGAIVLGIARALQARNPDLHERLSDGGFLTRDGRMVERKKYGYKKARKSFQFSKR